jgi:hypothetical protein
MVPTYGFQTQLHTQLTESGKQNSAERLRSSNWRQEFWLRTDSGESHYGRNSGESHYDWPAQFEVNFGLELVPLLGLLRVSIELTKTVPIVFGCSVPMSKSSD